MIVLDYHQGTVDDGAAFNNLPTLLEKAPGMRLGVGVSGALLNQPDQNLNPTQPGQMTALAIKNAALLTPDDKLSMLTGFFTLPDAQIVRFPRFLDLERKRGDKLDKASLTKVLPFFRESDWRDLQVVYILAGLPPEMLQTEPTHSIAAQLVGFSEQDKTTLLGLQARQNRTLLDKYQKSQQAGQLEMLAAPYGYLPLPLLANTAAARDHLDPQAVLPTTSFAFPTDVRGQLQKTQDLITTKLGSTAVGVLPSGGLVSPDTLAALSDAWLLSDETVLADSLKRPRFERDSNGVVQGAKELYQPYLAGATDHPTTIFFQDHKLADQLGSGYAGQPAQASAQDFVNRLKAVRTGLQNEKVEITDPRIVTLVLDGATAFKGYQDNGQAFLTELAKQMQADPTLKITLPGEYLKAHPAATRLDALATGGWVPSFDAWIGQSDKNKAWTYLAQARQALDPYLTSQTDPTKRSKAQEWLYTAENGPILTALGGDNLEAALTADQTFRAALTNAFKEVNAPVPAFLNQPITPAVARNPSRAVSGPISPIIDGRVSDQEWQDGGAYLETAINNDSTSTAILTPTPRPTGPVTITPTPTVAASSSANYLTGTYFGWDNQNIYLRLAASRSWLSIDSQPTVSFYLSDPHQKDDSRLNFVGRNANRPLGFGASYEVQIQINARQSSATALLSRSVGGGSWQAVQSGIEPVFAFGQNLEIALPWKYFPGLQASDRVYFTALLSKGGLDLQQVPGAGAGLLEVPDTFGLNQILVVKDKEGDDHGSGSYTYPVDSQLYKPGSFDLTNFVVATEDAKNLVLKLRIAGTLDNPQKAPGGFSLQTFDVYIHNPSAKEFPATALLPGRNARLTSGEAWQYAVVAEGWQPTLYKADRRGQPVKTEVDLKLEISPDKHTLTIRIPLAELGSSDPENWSYLPTVLGTETQPDDGVLRVKNVEVQATPDRFGGAPTDPTDGNHTRIIDVIVPASQGTQETLLSNYRSVAESNPGRLDPANLPLLYMLRVGRR